MEAQKLLDAAPFPPEEVKVFKEVFEEAWASLADAIPADRRDDTRMGLAHAIIAHAATGDHDTDRLKAIALDAVQRNPPIAAEEN